jgi:hypothetical protein
MLRTLHLDAPMCTERDAQPDDRCATTPLPVRDVPPLARLSTTRTHACGLTPGGELWCWGDGLARGFPARACARDAGDCAEPPGRVPW